MPPLTRTSPALRAGDLFAHLAYQRDLDATRVERMSGELDRTLLGLLEVSARDNGRYAIIDGPDRFAVVWLAGGGDETPTSSARSTPA